MPEQTSFKGGYADPSDDLVADLDRTYSGLRLAFVRMFRGLGIDGNAGSVVASELGINRQLAWQIATIVSEPICSAGLNVLPGRRGMELVIEACAARCTDSSLVKAASQALESFEAAVHTHAGDRASLSLLAAAWEPAEIEHRTESLRREGFRAQCALLGVQAKTQIRGVIYAPSRCGDASRVSMASYQCFSEVARFRRDHPVRLLYIETPTHDDGSLAMPIEEMPSHVSEKFRLEADLSSGCPEDIETVIQGNRAWINLKPGSIGRNATGTWIFSGSASYEHPRYQNGLDAYNHVGLTSLVPTETIHIDCLMDRSLAEHVALNSNLELLCFDASTGLPKRPIGRDDPAYLFDVFRRSPLGPAEIECDSSYPQLVSAVERAAARVGSRLDDLVGVRFTSMYVMSPMDFVIARKLPEASD